MKTHLALGIAFSLVFTSIILAQQDRTKLPIPLAPFEGKIEKTYKESESAWQSPVAAPKGAPNVIVILLDDPAFQKVAP